MSGGIDTGFGNSLNGHPNDKIIRMSNLVINPLNYNVKSSVHGLIFSAFSIGKKCYTISNMKGKTFITDSEAKESFEFAGSGNKEDFVLINDRLYEIMLFGEVNDVHVILIDLKTRILLSNKVFNNLENLGYNFLANYRDKHRLSLFDDFYKKVDGEPVMSVRINSERCIFDTDNKKRLICLSSTKEYIIDFKTISIITSSGEEYLFVQKENLRWEWVQMGDIKVI